MPRFHHFRIVVEHSRWIVWQFLTTIFATNIFKTWSCNTKYFEKQGIFFWHKVCMNLGLLYFKLLCVFFSIIHWQLTPNIMKINMVTLVKYSCKHNNTIHNNTISKVDYCMAKWCAKNLQKHKLTQGLAIIIKPL